MQAPVGSLLGSLDSCAETLTVGEPPGCKLCEALALIVRPVRPVPDEQADACAQFRAKLLARQHPGHGAAHIAAACLSLHVRLQAQVQLALQYDVQCLRQLPSDAVEVLDVAAPVMPSEAITTAEQLYQPALAIDQ
ncbi:hypothetical protein D3C81_1564240 [compost metagenome]